MAEVTNNEPIDMKELSEIMDNDNELAKECFTDFMNTSSEMLMKIKASIDAKDADSLDREAHKFKGTLRYLAALPAADRAYELEIMGKQKDFEKVGSTYDALVEECKRVKVYMSKYCEEGMGFKS